MRYNVNISITVNNDGGGYIDSINKTVKVETFAELNKLMGRMLQHIPKEKSNANG